MLGYSCLTRTISSTNAWRARKHINQAYFDNVRDIWYPRPEVIRTYGRLNRPGCPIMYAAASHHTAILELRPEVGDVFTVLQLRLTDQSKHPHVMELGVAERASQFGTSSSVRLLENTAVGRHFVRGHKNKNVLIRSFLAREFTRVVNRGQEHQFKLSIAISEILLDNPKIDGIEYPSMAGDIAAFKGGENIALKPASADRLYTADTCWVSVVEGTVSSPPEGFLMRCVRRARSIKQDGAIVW